MEADAMAGETGTNSSFTSKGVVGGQQSTNYSISSSSSSHSLSSASPSLQMEGGGGGCDTEISTKGAAGHGGVSKQQSVVVPIAPLVPLSLNLTLEDFESVLAEAIYIGGSSGETGTGLTAGAGLGGEKHPKEEARARTAAALERIRKLNWKKQLAPGGFFTS